MPTYTTLDTIAEVMEDKKIIHWKVQDEDLQLMHHYKPAASVLWRDAYNTLAKFVGKIEGSNYLMITLYSPDFKGAKGGDTSGTVFKYCYKLTSLSPAPVHNVPGMQDLSLFGLFQQIADLKSEMANQKQEVVISGLKAELAALKKEDKSYFSQAAEAMGEKMVKTFMEKEGIKPVKNKPKKSIAGTEEESAPATTGKDYGKRGAHAISRLVKVAGLDVIEGLEEMAAVAENDPAKLIAVMQAFKAEEEKETPVVPIKKAATKQVKAK